MKKTASVSLRQMLSVFSGKARVQPTVPEKSPCSADGSRKSPQSAGGSGKKLVDRLMVPGKSRD